MLHTKVLLEVLGWLVVAVGCVIELHAWCGGAGHRAPRVGVHGLGHALLPLVGRRARLGHARALARGRRHRHHPVGSHLAVWHHSVLCLDYGVIFWYSNTSSYLFPHPK